MIEGHAIYLRPLTVSDAHDSLRLQNDNRDFFEQFSMIREPSFYTLESQVEKIQLHEENRKNDQEYYFGLFQVMRGSLQSAFIGYFLDQHHNGKGYATEAVKALVCYAFEELHLHRIEAGVMPRNVPSQRVLEKAGFHREGIARKNVNINGVWEDHQVLAILNPNDEIEEINEFLKF
ncbi:GNAT family N-acetyltransferase [Priestia megaterium]|uniref:Ribosomal-protein-alanine N-acetyltransferase YjcK n=1 Tax=Priestia megaterium (strain WSH-002) TaxID=1006007 RepID=A0A8D4BMM4_PRIMW|nr:GNAT family protein [Priestia megaterium]AEN88788.1 Putative ribosomal-protein-alanine N-acetyltransferase YjcK [Priestia megaterium WSH-002]